MSNEPILAALIVLQDIANADPFNSREEFFTIAPQIVNDARIFLIELGKSNKRPQKITVEPVEEKLIRLSWDFKKKCTAEADFMEDGKVWVMVERNQTCTVADEFDIDHIDRIITFIYEE